MLSGPLVSKSYGECPVKCGGMCIWMCMCVGGAPSKAMWLLRMSLSVCGSLVGFWGGLDVHKLWGGESVGAGQAGCFICC